MELYCVNAMLNPLISLKTKVTVNKGTTVAFRESPLLNQYSTNARPKDVISRQVAFLFCPLSKYVRGLMNSEN